MREVSAKGFTLIELLVVVAIIGVLASVVLASLNSARDKGKVAKVQLDANQIYKAFYATVVDAGTDYLNKSDTAGQINVSETVWNVPNCNNAMDVSVSGDDHPNGEYVKQWATALNPYLKTISLDPWGQPYWIDAAYQCTAGEAAKCTAGSWYFVIGSGGPNYSTPNYYEADNVVVAFCKHP